MNLKETALEQILTNSYKSDLIAHMNGHPEDFEEAIKLAIADKQPYSWRAAWLLWSCMAVNDMRIRSYIQNIIDTIETKNDDHQRELLKILFQMELEEEFEGFIFNFCVGTWEKINKKPSVRFTAFTVLVKIAKKHPELYPEILLLTQNQYLDSLSSSAKKSISKMIKRELL